MLTDIQKERLEQLSQDKILFYTLLQVFNEEIERNTPRVNEVDNDETLGQKYRAYQEAKFLISECFKIIKMYEEKKISKEFLNKAI